MISLSAQLSQLTETAPAPTPKAKPAPKAKATTKRTPKWATLHEVTHDHVKIKLKGKSAGRKAYIVAWDGVDSRAGLRGQARVDTATVNRVRGDDHALIQCAIDNGAPITPLTPPITPIVTASIETPAPKATPAPVEPPAPTATPAPIEIAKTPRVDPWTPRDRLQVVDSQGRDIRPSFLPEWETQAGVEEITWSELMRYCSDRYYKLDETWALTWWSLISRTPLLITGLAGDGKTEVAELVRQITDFEQAIVQTNPYTEPSDLIGATSLKGLDHDLIARSWMDAPISKTGLLIDEFEKAGEGVQQALLSVLNERTLRDGGRSFELPILSLVGTSNGEIWDHAVRDRWTSTSFTGRYGDEFAEAFLNLPDEPFQTHKRVTSQQVDRWSAMAKKASSKASMRANADFLKRYLETVKYCSLSVMSEDGTTNGLSNRRIIQASRLMGAIASTHGRDYLTTSDLIAFKWLPHTPEQQSLMGTWLEKTMQIKPLSGYTAMYYSTLDQSEEELLSALMGKASAMMERLGL